MRKIFIGEIKTNEISGLLRLDKTEITENSSFRTPHYILFQIIDRGRLEACKFTCPYILARLNLQIPLPPRTMNKVYKIDLYYVLQNIEFKNLKKKKNTPRPFLLPAAHQSRVVPPYRSSSVYDTICINRCKFLIYSLNNNMV